MADTAPSPKASLFRSGWSNHATDWGRPSTLTPQVLAEELPGGGKDRVEGWQEVAGARAGSVGSGDTSGCSEAFLLRPGAWHGAQVGEAPPGLPT